MWCVLSYGHLFRCVCSESIPVITHFIPIALRYEFVNPSDKHVQWLWEVLEEFDNDDRARFIDFCYARCAPN